MTTEADVERALAEAQQREWAKMLAATACTVRDMDPLFGPCLRDSSRSEREMVMSEALALA